MARHVVRHIPVREGEGFDLTDDERVIACEWDPPIFHLVVLLADDGTHNDGPVEERTDG